MTLKNKKNAGFTLIELMIVVAIIAIIASVAIPKLMSARLAANESAAISTLRSIASAQAQLQSASAIDCDSDGAGEYGYLADLAGVANLRIDDGTGAATLTGGTPLTPSVLSAAFGNVQTGAAGEGVVTRSGYVFQLFLPDGANAGLAEATTGGGGATLPDENSAEILWCAYAWPIDTNRTGNRVFFINQEGDLLQYNNRGTTVYDDLDSGPAYDAVFITDDDMSSGLAIGNEVGNGQDSETWTVVQ